MSAVALRTRSQKTTTTDKKTGSRQSLRRKSMQMKSEFISSVMKSTPKAKARSSRRHSLAVTRGVYSDRPVSRRRSLGVTAHRTTRLFIVQWTCRYIYKKTTTIVFMHIFFEDIIVHIWHAYLKTFTFFCRAHTHTRCCYR